MGIGTTVTIPGGWFSCGPTPRRAPAPLNHRNFRPTKVGQGSVDEILDVLTNMESTQIVHNNGHRSFRGHELVLYKLVRALQAHQAKLTCHEPYAIVKGLGDWNPDLIFSWCHVASKKVGVLRPKYVVPETSVAPLRQTLVVVEVKHERSGVRTLRKQCVRAYEHFGHTACVLGLVYFPADGRRAERLGVYFLRGRFDAELARVLFGRLKLKPVEECILL